jgi:hypothetical protein
VKQIRVEHPGDAADPLALLILDHPARLVRIDGHPMTGKTSLARQLARVLGGIHVDTDSYLAGGELQQEQLIENLARYIASGLYVIMEGIRLEERCPSAGVPAFYIVTTSHYEDPADGIRPAEIAAELGVDRYLEQYRPIERADAEVIVRIPSEHASLIAEIGKLGAEDA